MSQWSLKQHIVFWWSLFLVIQQVERLFLLPDVMAIEPPSMGLLVNVLATGFRADLITSTIGILIVLIFGSVVGTLWWIATRWQREPKQWIVGYRCTFIAAGSVIAILLVALLLVDIGYYRFNQQRLNFVFFEYVGDLLTQWKETGLKESQAAGQTGAELDDHGKWTGTVLGFLFFVMLAVVTWWWCFTRMVGPVVSRFTNGAVLVPSVVLLTLAGLRIVNGTLVDQIPSTLACQPLIRAASHPLVCCPNGNA